MDLKKIIFLIIIIGIIIAAAAFIYNNNQKTDNINTTQTNNTTNITKNNNTNINDTNTTVNDTTADTDNYYSSTESSENEPAYGSDEYVEKWDQSQQGDGDWAYTHTQPVTTDDDGNEYSRVYHEDTGESTWESTSPTDNEN